MNLKQQLEKIQQDLLAIKDRAQKSNREFTDAEIKEIEAKSAEASELKAKILRAEKSEALLAAIGGAPDSEPTDGNGLIDGTKRLALTGPALKSAARALAPQIEETRQKTFLATGTTELYQVPLTTEIVELQRIPTSILELLPVRQHDVPQWQYLEQTAFVNNAAVVTPGDEKPVSTMKIEKRDGNLVIVAHLTEPVDKYMLEDFSTLESFVSGQLLYGLGRKIEDLVIAGDGTDGRGVAGKGIVGLLNRSGIQTQAFADDPLTTLRVAASKLEILGYTTGAYIMHPLDWAAIETQRATSGAFDLGGPIDRAQRKVWGTQVVTSTGVPQGTALGLDLDAANVDTDKQGIRVEWDRSGGFTTNEVQGRVEGRFGLTVTRPAAIIKATLTGTP